MSTESIHVNLVFFTHPKFLRHQSMPRFAGMLAAGMKNYGYNVEMWSPKPLFARLPFPSVLNKWLGYIDQYIIFPVQVRIRLKQCDADTLFVFTDNALGPWVPLVKDRPHVIHCHDFLAQNSALGKIQENRTGWTGRQYQAFIRRGYSRGKNFISVSHQTRAHLHALLPSSPLCSKVVYNGLNQPFAPLNPQRARLALQKKKQVLVYGKDTCFISAGINGIKTGLAL